MKQFTVKDALISLVPNAQWVLRGNEYSGIEWHDSVVTQPTEQEINSEISRLTEQYPLIECKNQAKKILQETDWCEIPSVSNVQNNPHLINIQEFITYRNTIRNFVINPVKNPVFPTIPTEQWSN